MFCGQFSKLGIDLFRLNKKNKRQLFVQREKLKLRKEFPKLSIKLEKV
jgi:hypothetical protein